MFFNRPDNPQNCPFPWGNLNPSTARWPQKLTQILYALTFQISTDFQNYFTARIRGKFATKIPPHLNCVVKLPCEMSSVLKATIENKTTSATTHFKKLTTGNNVLIVSVIVQSNCHILQFLHQMFNVSSLLLDDALLKYVVTEVVLFSIVAC